MSFHFIFKQFNLYLMVKNNTTNYAKIQIFFLFVKCLLKKIQNKKQTIIETMLMRRHRFEIRIDKVRTWRCRRDTEKQNSRPRRLKYSLEIFSGLFISLYKNCLSLNLFFQCIHHQVIA